MPGHLAIITDSTSSITPRQAADLDVTVVPLQVVIGARSFDEGTEATPRTVAEALRSFDPISTSRPTPEAFLRTYASLAELGAGAIVSVHLSAEISGTYDSAQMAAREASVPVHVVDSRHVGMATGFAVLSAVAARDAGSDADGVAAAANTCAQATRAFFYVDTLEYLRRGGRIGAAAALLGSALAVKPLLTVSEGRIGPLEKVRTASRALSRLEELTVAAVGELGVPARIAVQHLANPDKASEVAARLVERLGLDDIHVSEVGAVIGAHVGPGMVAVAVAPQIG